MKFDDASWHSGGGFPSDVPEDNGATHIAVFYVWLVLHGLADETQLREQDLEALRNRTLTPTDFFLRVCDGKLTDEDLTSRGFEFASAYYAHGYFSDYADLVEWGETVYHAPPTWEPYDRMSALLETRYETYNDQTATQSG